MHHENFQVMEKIALSKEKLEQNVAIEVVCDFNEQRLKNILNLEKECFPASWQYEDAKEYYEKMLRDQENINVFLESSGTVVGYILARSKLNDQEINDLRESDPALNDIYGFYIETIQILPEFQNKGGAKKLLIAICEEAKKRGIEKFSIHARTKNKFNDKIKKIFEGKITLVRQIEKWAPADGEPYEYIEWENK